MYFFISYHHSDREDAKRIQSILQTNSIDSFFAEKTIEYGERIPNRIKEEIERATHLVVIISPGSQESEWVPYEIGLAVANNIKIFSILTHPLIKLPDFLKGSKFFENVDAFEKFISKFGGPPPPPRTDWRHFFDFFSTWRARNLGLNINYSILVDTSGSMREKEGGKPRIEHAKHIATYIIDQIHSTDRFDNGNIYRFDKKLNRIISSRNKNQLQGAIEDIYIKARPATLLWQSIKKVVLHHKENKSRAFNTNYILVLTDGLDNLSEDLSDHYTDSDDIQKNPHTTLTHNKSCFDKIMKIYQEESSLPFLFIVALSGESEEIVWKNIQDQIAKTEFRGYIPISIEFSNSMGHIKQIFQKHFITIKENLIRIGTVENWIWSILNKTMPPPRSVIYPGALLATLIYTGEYGYPFKFSSTNLIANLLNLLNNIIDIEYFEPLAMGLEAGISETQYYSFLDQLNDEKLEAYVKLILSASEKLGWLVKNKDHYLIEVVQGSIAHYMLCEYFLSNKWKHDTNNAILKNHIMPKIRKMANDNNIGFPLFSADQIREIIL